MSKYELTISKDYVPNWTVVDAVRELFQNAIDQQTTVKGNDMFFEFNIKQEADTLGHVAYSRGTAGTLRIGNKLSVLSVKTLLLGESTKRNDKNTIGQFGEGYKIATLVLTRLGKRVTIYNYGAREVWHARFVKSKRYGTEVLTFFVDKKFLWARVPDNNLTIEVDGITVEEYKEIIASNLHLNKPKEVIETKYGRILLDKQFKGKVFVNGLFVCNYEPYTYGYDFKPSELTLDRDRKLATDFDLKWLASKMWAVAPPDGKAAELAASGVADVEFINYMKGHGINTHTEIIATQALENFKKQYGSNAVPVVDQDELEIIDEGYKPVIVKRAFYDLIKSSPDYIPAPIVQKKSPKEKLQDWLNTHRQSLSKKAIKQLMEIMEEL